MHTRCLLIASAALAIASAAGAEPPKAEVRETVKAADRSAEVVLASAEQVPPVPAGEAQAATPAKRKRAARVTTCRCADQKIAERP